MITQKSIVTSFQLSNLIFFSFVSPQYSRDEYDRYYRGGADDYYRRKDEPYRDPYREPWNGRREPDGMYLHTENDIYIFFFNENVLFSGITMK